MSRVKKQADQEFDRDISNLMLSKEDATDRFHWVAQRLLHAQEEERRHISREMHDDIGNRVVLLAFSIRRLMNRHPAREYTEELDGLLVKTTELSEALRRLSHNLHPSTLQFGRIESSLKSLCRDVANATGLKIETAISPGIDVRSDVALCLYRVTQECLQNIIKHSGAEFARVILTLTSRYVRLKIYDNGRGFRQAAALRNPGLGLTCIKERVRSLGGRMEIETGAGRGTLVRLTIPSNILRRNYEASTSITGGRSRNAA